MRSGGGQDHEARYMAIQTVSSVREESHEKGRKQPKACREDS
jgi:hypothetical protein